MTGTDVDGALAEYQSLRAEIDSRAKFQQQILGLQLTLTSAIVAFGLSRGLVGILLIVPLSSYLLCGRYVGQRTAIRWTTKYIDEELAPRVPGGLGWGAWSQANRRPARLWDWLLPLLICFPGASLLALGWTIRLVTAPHSWHTATGLGIVWVVGLFAAGASLYLLGDVFGHPLAPRRRSKSSANGSQMTTTPASAPSTAVGASPTSLPAQKPVSPESVPPPVG